MSLRTPNIQILKADFTNAALAELLLVHQKWVDSPERNLTGGKTYVLNLNDLQSPNIHLWTVWDSDTTAQPELLGCGALKVLPQQPGTVAAGELKSMHTVAAARGKGIGTLLVEHLVGEARRLGLGRLHLETGSVDAFAASRSFYYGCGFVKGQRYAEYNDAENSYFMVKQL